MEDTGIIKNLDINKLSLPTEGPKNYVKIKYAKRKLHQFGQYVNIPNYDNWMF